MDPSLLMCLALLRVPQQHTGMPYFFATCEHLSAQHHHLVKLQAHSVCKKVWGTRKEEVQSNFLRQTWADIIRSRSLHAKMIDTFVKVSYSRGNLKRKDFYYN